MIINLSLTERKISIYTIGFMQQHVETNKVKNLILSAALTESKYLYIQWTFAANLVPRSFNSLCSLVRTTAFEVILKD